MQLALSKNKPDIIYSVQQNETELINNILFLYNQGERIELDATYSRGRIWRNLDKPTHKFDINPVIGGVNYADCRNLPVKNESIKSILFDPPFIANTSRHNLGRIATRFSSFHTMDELQQMYSDSLCEFYRVLKPNGLLVFKCQDIVGKDHYQYLTHVFVINRAEGIGYYARDLFVLHNKSKMISGHLKRQKHARKSHSYYLVFLKNKTSKCLASCEKSH